MMKHLTDAEFVDLIEGQLDPARARHADGCASCHDKGAALLAVRDEALDIGHAEPSPLFWDHFAARVSGAIANEPEPATAPDWTEWLRNPAVTWAAAASLATILMVGALWRATVVAPEDTPARSVTAMSGAASPDPLEDLDDLDRDRAWVEARSVADDFAWEDSIGIAPRPGSAERVVLELTNEERAELARLLEDELKRRGV